MKNIDIKIEKDTLVIRIDLKKDFGPSESKKSIIIASSEGNQGVGRDDIKFGLNVYRTNPEYVKGE